MNVRTARLQMDRSLQFGDPDQIAAYQYLERIAEIERVLEGDDSDQHLQAVEDALGESGWLQHIRLEIIQARNHQAVSLPACGSLPSPIEP